MKYRVDISGMYCSGCETLIKMSLEEANFNSIEVSMKNSFATFNSQQDPALVKKSLDNVFAVFEKYKYANLVLV